MKRTVFLCLTGCLMMLLGCRNDPGIPAVKNFQLERYMGKWYEIARLPNRFERGMSQVSAEYTRLADGRIKVVNQGVREGKRVSITGYARTAGNASGGDLQVSFFRPFYGMYRIVKLDPDHSCSVVIGKSRNHLWILGRKKELSPAEKQEIMDFLRQHQIPAENLIWSWQ